MRDWPRDPREDPSADDLVDVGHDKYLVTETFWKGRRYVKYIAADGNHTVTLHKWRRMFREGADA